MLVLVAEFDRRKAWSDGEMQSCAHWLNLSMRKEQRARRARGALPEADAHRLGAPYDGDATLAELQRPADLGVKAIKLHPRTQQFDAADERVLPAAHAGAFSRCADAAKLPDLADSLCAKISVPLSYRSGPIAIRDRQIDLFICRFPALGESKGEVWLIAGGPGESGASLYPLISTLSGSGHPSALPARLVNRRMRNRASGGAGGLRSLRIWAGWEHTVSPVVAARGEDDDESRDVDGAARTASGGGGTRSD